jgi:hypothetical protein
MKIEEFPPAEREVAAESARDDGAEPASTDSRWRRRLTLPLVALAVVGLTAAGIVGLVGVIGNLNQERAYSTDPDVARRRLRETISIELPAEFEPECSAEMRQLLSGERISIWSMYQWHDSDSFVLVARSTKDVTKVQRPGDPPRASDSVDLTRYVQELLFDRGRVYEPVFFGEPEKLDDRNPDGSLTKPRNRVEPLGAQQLDKLLHDQRAKVEEVETIELLGHKVKVWFAAGTGAVNEEPYWQVVTGIPVPEGSVLFYLQAKKSELSREQIEQIVRSIGEPQPDSAATD